MTETPQEFVENAQHAKHAAAEGGIRAAIIPLSIAIMAVVAVVFETMETTASTTAAIARSDAAIRQNEATDLWGEYQAESPGGKLRMPLRACSPIARWKLQRPCKLSPA